MNQLIRVTWALLMGMLSFSSRAADLIPESRRVPYVVDVTVGVRGGIPARTTVGGNIYPTNSLSYMNAVVNGVGSGQVVLFHDTNGPTIFDIRGVLEITRSDVTLRATSTNCILVGKITAGRSPSVGSYGSFRFGVVNGTATKGSTTLQLTNAGGLDLYGQSFAVGDMLYIDALFYGDEHFQYIANNGTKETATANRLHKQMLTVTSVSGTNIGITPPLDYDFTNTANLLPMQLLGVPSVAPISGIGLEGFTLAGTNFTVNGGIDSDTTFMLFMQLMRDSWVTNCHLLYGGRFEGSGFSTYVFAVNHVSWLHNTTRFAKSAGSSRAGLAWDNGYGGSGWLVADSPFTDGLGPGIELNQGTCGNAFVGNFFTNNVTDIVTHNTHPMMNLFEANIWFSWVQDGYFGSSSHYTVLRNRGFGTISANRFSTYDNFLGNVLGSPALPVVYLQQDFNGSYGVFRFGFPNISNREFWGTSPPAPWDYPGPTSYGGYTNAGLLVNTTVGPTNFIADSKITGPVIGYITTNVPVIFQAPAPDTNIFYYANAIVIATNAGGVTFNTPVTASNGFRIFVADTAYRQNRNDWSSSNHIVTANIVCTNQSTYVLVGSTNGLMETLIYSNGVATVKPGWWYADLLFPAFGPGVENSETNLNPAAWRYYNGERAQGGGGSPATQAKTLLQRVRITGKGAWFQ